MTNTGSRHGTIRHRSDDRCRTTNAASTAPAAMAEATPSSTPPRIAAMKNRHEAQAIRNSHRSAGTCGAGGT